MRINESSSYHTGLLEILDYLETTAPFYLEPLFLELEEMEYQLQEFPAMFPESPPQSGIHRAALKLPYIVRYRILSDSIQLLTIRHTARQGE